MYIVAGTAFDVNSSSRDGFSRRLAIMDAATEGAATPVALPELPLACYDSETNRGRVPVRLSRSDMAC
jgi:hypothetical protein